VTIDDDGDFAVAAGSPPPSTVNDANYKGVDLTASVRIQANPDVRDEGAAW